MTQETLEFVPPPPFFPGAPEWRLLRVVRTLKVLSETWVITLGPARVTATVIEQRPDVPIWYALSGIGIAEGVLYHDPSEVFFIIRRHLAELAAAMGTEWVKNPDDDKRYWFKNGGDGWSYHNTGPVLGIAGVALSPPEDEE